MIIDDINNSYSRFINLCKTIEDEKNQEIAFQKLCYVIFRLREICVELDDFSKDYCMDKELDNEQRIFYENMKYIEKAMDYMLPNFLNNH